MAGGEKEEIPMLSYTQSRQSDDFLDVQPQRFSSRNRSASMSTPMHSMDSDERETYFVSHTGPLQSERRTPFKQMSGPIHNTWRSDKLVWPVIGLMGRPSATVLNIEQPSFNGAENKGWHENNHFGKNDHLLKSGQLGVCNDPYCTTCPAIYNSKFHNMLSGDGKGWMRRSFSFLGSYVPVMNPHNKVVQRWNKFFVISCLVAIFVDPLFFFLLSVEKENKCIVFDWVMATTIAVVRSITDFIYLLHMLLQFRLAYVAPESRVVGAGEWVDQPKKIAFNYLYGNFFIDVFVVLPLPQVLFYRFLPMFAGRSANGFIFETAWANFVINLLIFVLSGHVVGSCWYLFGLQRVNQCLRDACADSKLSNCKLFIDCGREVNAEKFMQFPDWKDWPNNENATRCFDKDGHFTYGIYEQAVNITTKHSVVTRYIYSLFWGFQQISTLAGNQVPSDFVWEVLFTMGIVGLGLFLFALLIGNMQNFLQALGRRRLEMQLRHRDVEQWMSHRRLPQELRRQVRQSERYHWAATRGVNEEVLLEKFPDDLQREIRRHLFGFIKKVRFFALMEEPILDAVCERLRQKLYIKGSKILYKGGVVDKMIFIVRGKMVSVYTDENDAPLSEAHLSEGDICGEELITWCFDRSSVNKGRN
ncbi:hypothetical protein AQUCO_00201333v1 [Aquilegia coerulea]|uniref:Cyclic nucleotide-binding domain-containing protein n=1 Tax=Aquilegia coerulea TaxID=218851 RepID=A0A2G5F7F6_AQUCA|nr:hypothetical protein AQUCO_00201333v1 [Aquilegia coerulea]